RAFLSGGVVVHQFCRVGRLAMVGGNSKVVQDCLPFVIADGVPARARGLNLVGLRRAGVPASSIRALKEACRLLMRGGLPLADAPGPRPFPLAARGQAVKAMILAAGFGTRVRPLTEGLPKPMVPIINKPVMEFLVELLRRHGFDQIIVSTAYLANEIESYFGDGSLFGVQIAYSFEGYHEGGEVRTAGLGSAGALRAVQDFSGFSDDSFVGLCGGAVVH